MKTIITSFILLIATSNLFAQSNKQIFVTSDIDNFWDAYDKIITTKDSALQHTYLNNLFIEKGSEGLKKIMQVRRYTPQQYIDAINNYPLFWKSIRVNTNKAKLLTQEVETDVNRLREIYPNLKPSTIYFTIGAYRTNGTILGNNVLIGSEMALGDTNVVTTEFPKQFSHIESYFKEHPINNIALLNVHEYVHTQQKQLVENLLLSALYEGVAEFVSTKATGKASTVPAIIFGKNNELIVKKKFEEDMFNPAKLYNWLWGTNQNELKIRDLGYFIGYAICEKNYELAKDKKAAIKEMIELDFTNDKKVENFIDRTKFFSNTIENLNKSYEKSRPTIIGITQFKNGSKHVSPSLTQITINFSSAMDKTTRGFDYGPLGEENVLRVKNVIGFSEDGKSFTFEVELKPNRKYQSLLTNRFRALNGIPLKPFLIEIETLDK